MSDDAEPTEPLSLQQVKRVSFERGVGKGGEQKTGLNGTRRPKRAKREKILARRRYKQTTKKNKKYLRAKLSVRK